MLRWYLKTTNATSDKKEREFLIFRQLNNGTKIDSPSRFLPAFRFRSIETVEFFAEEYSINLAGYYDRREGWGDSIRDGMEAAIFHGGSGCQRFEFAGSSIKSTSVGARDAFSLSLSFSSLLAVRNAFTFVSVGYEFVRDLRSAVVHRHRGTLKVRFRKNEESENKKRKKFELLIIRQRNKIEKTIRWDRQWFTVINLPNSG